MRRLLCLGITLLCGLSATGCYSWKSYYDPMTGLMMCRGHSIGNSTSPPWSAGVGHKKCKHGRGRHCQPACGGACGGMCGAPVSTFAPEMLGSEWSVSPPACGCETGMPIDTTTTVPPQHTHAPSQPNPDVIPAPPAAYSPAPAQPTLGTSVQPSSHWIPTQNF